MTHILATNLLAEFFSFLCLGAISGFLAGLLGIGGGLIIVPALVLVFSIMGFPENLLMQMAAGSSLLIMIFTASASIWGHQRRKNIVWPIVKRMTPWLILGTLLGAFLADLLHSDFISFIFAAMLLVMGFKMALGIKPKTGKKMGMNQYIMSTIGCGVGMIAGLLGIGGGAFSVPYLVYCAMPMRKAMGTSAAFTLPVAIIGAIAFTLFGFNDSADINWSTGYIYWPAVLAIVPASMLFAPLGTKLTAILPASILSRIFSILLFILAAKMLYFALH